MTTRDNRNFRQIVRKAIPLQKAHVHDTAATADTDILDSDIEPSDPPCLFRVQVQLDTAAVFSAMVDDESSEVQLKFNSGAQLAAGALYIFDMLVESGDDVNFQADENVNVDKLLVHEVVWATQ